MTSKFRGRYMQITPMGCNQFRFPDKGYVMTYNRLTTTVHNIIVGKLWVDNHGDCEVINHATGDVCNIKVLPYSYFSREGGSRRVSGTVSDKDGNVKWVISGSWDESLTGAEVLRTYQQYGKTVLDTGPVKYLWTADKKPPPGSESYYNMGVLACQLNEMEEGIAPTDSRFRPDQRCMEDGDFDTANTEKVKLEEKQRAVRRKREAEVEEAKRTGQPLPPPYMPLWFKPDYDEYTGLMLHNYLGGYWEAKEKQEWSMCPDIY